MTHASRNVELHCVVRLKDKLPRRLQRMLADAIDFRTHMQLVDLRIHVSNFFQL